MTTLRRAARIGSTTGALAVIILAGVGQVAQASDATLPVCSSADLSARQTGSGAGMSQPYSQITVTNTSASFCSLNGYPTITRAWTKGGRKAIRVTNGNLQNIAGPGPRRIVLAPGGHAWFAVGAATAYDPPLVNFTRIAFAPTPSGNASASVVARLLLPATAPNGKPFPIGVTAFAPGSHP